MAFGAWIEIFLFGFILRARGQLQCSNVVVNNRVDCYPEPNADQQKCESRGK